MRIHIKALSVNQAWKGRRFKTKEYKQYEKDVLLLLKPLEIPDGELMLKVSVGFSSKGSDLDNVMKPFLDILQKKYGFNDSRIYQIAMNKILVMKGNEFIDFELWKD